MSFEMKGDFRKMRESIDQEIKRKRKKPFIIASYNENKENQYDFNVDLVKKYLEKINEYYPNNNFDFKFIYKMKEKYIVDTNKCKELEKIDNYLRENKGTQLYIQESDQIILDYGFRDTLNANRKLDEIANKIRNSKYNNEPLSTFEKFMLIYEYVTDFSYNKGNYVFNVFSCHWVPVMEGDKIVCSGYASLLQALCERVFDNYEMKVFCNHMKLNKKNTNESLGGHANNIVFIKDEKYNIKGMFYVDACWDSENENHRKTHSYCCIPITDIMKDKDCGFKFNYTSPDNIEEEFKDFFDLNKKKRRNFFERFNLFKKINELFKSLEYKESVSLQYFIDNYEKLPNKSIVPIEAFINSFKIIGDKKGLKGEELKKFVKEKIEYNVFVTKKLFDSEECKGCFATYSFEDDKKEIMKKK